MFLVSRVVIAVSKIRSSLSIDPSIGWAIANRAFNVVKGPITVFFIIRFMTPADQGLWYTFGSLGALTLFAELGFASIISQFVSHDFAKVNFTKGFVQGELSAVERLIGFVRFAIRFYFIVVPVAITILAAVGYFYFKNLPANVYIAWCFFSVVGGFALILNLFQSIYQGLDRVKQIQINTLVASLLSTLANWAMLISNFKIWALVAGNFTGLAVATYMLYRHAPLFWRQVIGQPISIKHNFFKETIKLQGKYALSWISGYFVFFLAIPASYKFAGEIIAGQLGITFAVVSAINGVSASWLSTKVPKLNMLVSLRDFATLNQLFKASMRLALIVQTTLSLAFLGILMLLSHSLPEFASRFLTIQLTSILLITQLAQTVINSMAIYLRSFKQEPYFLLSVLNAILMAAFIFIILKHFGFVAFLVSESLLIVAIMLPLAFLVYKKFKERNALYT